MKFLIILILGLSLNAQATSKKDLETFFQYQTLSEAQKNDIKAVIKFYEDESNGDISNLSNEELKSYFHLEATLLYRNLNIFGYLRITLSHDGGFESAAIYNQVHGEIEKIRIMKCPNTTSSVETTCLSEKEQLLASIRIIQTASASIEKNIQSNLEKAHKLYLELTNQSNFE